MGTGASKALSVQALGWVDPRQCCGKFTEHEVWQKMKNQCMTDTHPAGLYGPISYFCATEAYAHILFIMPSGLEGRENRAAAAEHTSRQFMTILLHSLHEKV